MESSSKDKRRSGRGLFRRVWKGLKSPFRRRKEDKVVDFVAESEVDESGIDIVQILRPTRTDSVRPDPCLPGQLFGDEEVAAAPGPQPGTSLPPPEPSPDAPEENPRRTSQNKTVCSFFRKWHKTLRNLFLPRPPTEDRAQGLPASEPESSLLPEEFPVTLPDPEPIPASEEPPSSRHFHPSFLELEDLAFGNEVFCPPEIEDHDSFLAGPAYVWCLGAIYKEIMKACETNGYRLTIRRCLSRDPADRPTLDELQSRLRRSRS
ncbi:hypothetical protein DNTS_003726 [Danionella cerebrum]|uniref:Protein kinase domain-containing protein n=1 Tax=Danionella cerebrum TaxID=2873325 RepID=A0A553Q4L2_9TELE|nr:hypothetical protein DNTS_003726 [Danionella translucida]